MRHEKCRSKERVASYSCLTAHGKVGMARYPKWRRSLLIRAETRDFHSRRVVMMHTSDHRRSKISSFTPSLGRLLKERKLHMSDFSCGETKVRNDP